MPKFEIGNKAAEKWSESDAVEAFETALQNTIDNEDVLCVQDAFFSIDMMPNYAHHLVKRFPVLEDYKKAINDKVISRINKGALKNKMNNAAAIWRMKQLGEKDQQYMQSDNTNKNIHRELTGEEKEAEIKEIKKQLDELSDY
jgi:hypothetical protein